MALEKERQTYERELSKLLDNEGHYALVHDEQIVGVWETYEDALKDGYAKFGTDESFLVKQIESVERVYFFSRDVSRCQS